MPNRTVLVLPKLDAAQAERIRSAAPGWIVAFAADAAENPALYREAEVIAGWNEAAARHALEEDSALRWVQAWGAGVDKLPLAAFKRRGIWLTNAKGVHPYPISESVFAMILAFTRQLHLAVRNQSERRWGAFASMEEAHGKTIGILGVGAIGREVAHIARAFGMTVLGVRRSGEPDPSVDRMETLDGLDAVLAESDFVVNCLPLTPETHRLIDEGRLARMKPSAFYINIGRGATTDTDALVDALRSGKIAGAGLDVFEREPLPDDHPLWEMDNVIITPHNAGATTQYRQRTVELFAANLNAYAGGEAPPINRVDLDRQY